MREEEFIRWLRANDFSDTTIVRTVRYVKYIERQGLDLDSIRTEEDVLDYFSKMRERGVSRKALNNHVKMINRYLRFRGLPIKIPYYREFRSEDIIILRDEEVKRLLEVKWGRVDIDKRNRAMLTVLFATGVRISELVALNWQDLIFDPAVEMHLIKVRHGKWEKSREIPIPPQVVHILDDYRQFAYRSDPNAMFTTPAGRLSLGYARRIMALAGQKAGVPYFHAHLARHWRAVKWLEAGVDLEAIRRLLGHSSLKVTQIYLRARSRERALKEVVKDRFFGSWEVEI
ncbi:MAG: tyrosine-type recombinase/integrase [Thermoplasmata archaeon]|nr:tyrosine-type recombinase/integrase [Thermoplasmata archaeon]